MRCPHCTQPIPGDRDFCPHCRSYLRWEPPGVQPAVATALPPVIAQRAPREPQRPALLTLASGDEAPSGLPVVAEVEPGERVAVRALVRNIGPVTASFRLAVVGLHGSWWSPVPEMLHLNPYGTQEPWEGEIVLYVNPPHSPLAEARDWPFTVSLVLGDSGRRVARSGAVLRIAPYAEHGLHVRPTRRRVRLELALENRGNGPLEVEFDASPDQVRAHDDAPRPRFDR